MFLVVNNLNQPCCWGWNFPCWPLLEAE